MIEWPDLTKILRPCKGKHIAVVRDRVAKTTLLVDLDEYFVAMSDSEIEKSINIEVVEKAKGDVLILGFGLGFILVPIMNKPEVTSVTVIEIEPEVIELIASQIPINEKVRIVIDNALTYKPDKLYDIIYNDIDIHERDLRLLSPHANMRWDIWYKSFLKPCGEYLEWRNK